MDETTPSGREMEILKVLWELGRGSVRDVYRRMCPNDELAYNTVQTLIRERTGLSRKSRADICLHAPLQPPTGHVAIPPASFRRGDRPGRGEHAQCRGPQPQGTP